jgi:acyl-CoA synthetase (NDP forming)
MRMSARSNGELLNPKSVAVIGATEDQTKFGGRLYRMLLKHHYAGVVYPINPRRAELFGLKAYPALGDTPAIPDMIVMAVPRPSVIENITEAARLGVKCAIIITSKFSDEGKEGARIEAELVATARRGGMRLIGPNCLGVISPANRLVLCSSPALEADTLPQEPIGFVSQSGALMATVFDRARDRGIGFSHCVSVGNQADLELCDFLEYFIEDTRTGIVCAYVEGIKDPARFLVLADRAREVGKPILMVKAGRTAMGARAAYSHTASLAGSFAALEAVCRDRGVVLMDDLDAMVLLASSLGRYPGRAVRSACLITTSGGGGAIASDRLAERGVPLTEFAPATQAALTQWYSPGQANNPIDLGGRLPGGEAVDVADTTMTIAADDPAHDVLLPLITTAPMLANTVGKMADAAAARGKPCLFIMAPGHAADGARQALIERRIPFADSLDEAVRAVHAWHTMPNAGVRPTVTRPVGLPETAPPVTGQLDPVAVEGLLAAYGLPLVPQKICRDHASALAAAREMGFPVVLKAVAAALVHKSDAGGVVVNIATEAALAETLADLDRRLGPLEGYLVQQMVSAGAELILGVKHDEQFGPMLVVGAGGILVELLHDAALSTVPVSLEGARALLDRLKVKAILNGIRGGAALDQEAVVDAIMRLSWLAHDLRGRLLELDINPLLVRPAGQGCVVVDARVLCT